MMLWVVGTDVLVFVAKHDGWMDGRKGGDNVLLWLLGLA
jgi:hypothetical protein